MNVAKVTFLSCAGLLAYTHAGYLLLLTLLARRRPPPQPISLDAELPTVSVIVAAYAEETVIGERVENLGLLDYPAERLEVIVACDGSPDATADRARAGGADHVIELSRGGKIRAQDVAVQRSTGEIVAFSDANARWERSALRALVGAFADPRVGYACGQVSFVGEEGTNQEGLYWRYEMAIRSLESRLRSITAGNGAIYATRREDYLIVDPIMGHDLSLPFNMVKRGRRAVYVPGARAWERMVPSIEGEFARKRRMMSHGWPIIVRGGMLSPQGYDPLYATMIVSHRLLRYLSPFLHFGALLASVRLARVPSYALVLVGQLALLGMAALGGRVRARPFLVARYYVLTTASLAAGLWDWLARGTEAGWEPAEGTR